MLRRRNLILTRAAIAALAIVSLPFLLCVLPMLWGWSSYVVITGSMGPTIPVGSVVVTQPVSAEELVVGDIILFKYKSANVLHRVTGYSAAGDPQEGFYTQGDYNSKGEPLLVQQENIRGRFAYQVPYVGYLVQWVQHNIWLLAGVALAGWWWLRKTRQGLDAVEAEVETEVEMEEETDADADAKATDDSKASERSRSGGRNSGSSDGSDSGEGNSSLWWRVGLVVLLTGVLMLTLQSSAYALFSRNSNNSSSQLASGNGIWFYYIFDSTSTLQFHDPTRTISTGRNRTLAVDYGVVGRVVDSLRVVPNVIRITNKGPASSLTFAIANGTSPPLNLFQLDDIVAVPGTLTIAKDQTRLLSMQYKLLTLISLPGTYTGSLRITDTTTGLYWDVPITLVLNLLL
ncbi:signal peptidase I [Paenibacillus koleovorans]|uniref:signal peptidase I n=1 Tax=Paenibacillus koleovorans TaxID=121608 RepID=UPI000FDAF451|nr:signal peptidase I [Paenibacillus koleovorans]